MLPLIGPFKYFLLPGKKGTVILKKYVNMKKMRPNNVRRTVCLLMYKSFKVLVKTLWTFSIVDIRQNELYLIIDNSWKINKGQTSCRGQCNIQLQGRLHQKRAKRYKWYLKIFPAGACRFVSARRGPGRVKIWGGVPRLPPHSSSPSPLCKSLFPIFPKSILGLPG